MLRETEKRVKSVIRRPDDLAFPVARDARASIAGCRNGNPLMKKILLNKMFGPAKLMGATAVGLVMTTGLALAQVRDLGGIAQSLSTQTTQFATLLSILSFVIGVGMGIAGFMKFKQNAQNPNDPSAKISTAFILIFVGAGLVALPAVFGSGLQTIFGGQSGTINATTGFTTIGQ